MTRVPPAATADPNDAIAALVALSRAITEAAEPLDIPPLLAEAAWRHLGASVVAVFATNATGEPDLVEVRGALPGELHRPEMLDSALGDAVLAGVRGVDATHTWLLLSAGGLFGALVAGFPTGRPLSAFGSQLGEGFADVAATGLDRAYRTSELVHTIADLQASRAELARSESLRRLGQMAAVVAHEVKNPLASIAGVLQILRTRFAAESQESTLIGKLLDRNTELARMVDELLQFARPHRPSPLPASCSAVLSDAVEQFRRDPLAAGVRIVEVPGPDVIAAIDRGMLGRVLLNLLINASQATHGRGEVTLSVTRRDRFAELRVADDGPGIPEERREQIFEPFFTTKTRGSGLGLAVARVAVEGHGGTIHVEAAPSGGACFVVAVPAVG